MHRIASRAMRATFCTAFATALCVPASAAPGSGSEQVYHTITLQETRLSGVQSTPSIGRSDGRLQQLEVHSIHWGSASPMVMKGSNIGENSTAPGGGVSVAAGDLNGDGTAAPRKPTIGRATISPKSLPGSAGANETLTVGSNQTESGQATGKRQHMPLRARMYYDAPQGQGPGSLTVRGSFPSCTVGQRYAGAQFAGGGMSYVLQDLEIADCGGTSAGPTEEITFVYGKVVVRGWDPAKKEQ